MMQTVQAEQYLRKTCKKIIGLDSRIRFAGIINERGRLITGAAKNRIQFLVDKKDREMLFMETALRTRMRREFDHCLGSSNFSLTHRENVIIMKFPIGNETIYVSAEKDIKLDELPFEIHKILPKKESIVF